MKKALSFFAMLCCAFSLVACGAPAEPQIPDLTGGWKQVNTTSADSYQQAVIQGDTIEIYWVSNGGDTKSLYWAGTFVAPTTPDEPYTWDSVNDTEKTSSALLASTAETKTFTYEKKQISYSASAFGTTTTVRLEKQADYVPEEDALAQDKAQEPNSASHTEKSEPTASPSDGQEVSDVTITLPTSFFEAFDTAKKPYNAETFAAAYANSTMKSMEIHEDGSLTFTISKEDHENTLQSLHDTVASSIDILKKSFPSVRDLEVNDDCSELTLIVDKASYKDTLDTLAPIMIRPQINMYQGFNGTFDKEVTVNIKDEASGEIFDTVTFKN